VQSDKGKRFRWPETRDFISLGGAATPALRPCRRHWLVPWRSSWDTSHRGYHWANICLHHWSSIQASPKMWQILVSIPDECEILKFHNCIYVYYKLHLYAYCSRILLAFTTKILSVCQTYLGFHNLTFSNLTLLSVQNLTWTYIHQKLHVLTSCLKNLYEHTLFLRCPLCYTSILFLTIKHFFSLLSVNFLSFFSPFLLLLAIVSYACNLKSYYDVICTLGTLCNAEW